LVFHNGKGAEHIKSGRKNCCFPCPN